MQLSNCWYDEEFYNALTTFKLVWYPSSNA